MSAVDKFKDPVWRLHNLYWITDKAGKVVKFQPNAEQTQFLEALHYRNVILKARQLGFSTLIQLVELDAVVFNSNVRAGVIAQSLDDVTTIFRDKIKFAYDRLPEAIKAERHPISDSSTELLLSNNSSVRVGTSMRGGTLQYLHISEFGKICAKFPEKAREIVTGAIPALSPDGFLFVESTAEGREGPFYDLCQAAQRRVGRPLLPIEERFHFFPWFNRAEYEADPAGVAISAKEHEYFDEVQRKTGAKLTEAKRAWYVLTAEKLAGDMKREYPSTAEEAFEQSNEGAWYREQMKAARAQSRICRVPHEPGSPVNTFWDLGANDTTAIWFHQRIGPENRWLKFHEANGKTLDYFVDFINKTGYVQGKHYLPHDATHKRLQQGFQNRSVEQMLNDLGLRNTVIVPRISDVVVGIQQTRLAFPSSYFDEEGCKEGIEHLDNYSKEWDKANGCWKEYPKHDIHSNGADAFRQFGQMSHALAVDQWGGSLKYPSLGIV